LNTALFLANRQTLSPPFHSNQQSENLPYQAGSKPEFPKQERSRHLNAYCWTLQLSLKTALAFALTFYSKQQSQNPSPLGEIHSFIASCSGKFPPSEPFAVEHCKISLGEKTWFSPGPFTAIHAESQLS